MFVIDLASMSEVKNVAVELQFAQNQVRAVHGYAIIGIQRVVEDDVDQLSLLELGCSFAFRSSWKGSFLAVGCSWRVGS